MNSSENVKLLLVDDSQIVLDGLMYNFINEKGIEVAGEANTAKEVFEFLDRQLPDIILLDISLEKQSDGIDILKKVAVKYPSIKVIMLSHNKDVVSIVSSIQSGAHAYLSKDSRIDEILDAIAVVHKGNGIFFGETIPRETLANCFKGQPKPENFHPYNLSGREIEIILWLAKGYMSKEIGDILNINPSTVETHKENIKSKLGLKSVIEVVVFALKQGLIQP